jgi:AbrB family looped-hinge helix DNA binding protein
MVHGMITTIDAAGRIVVPKEVREQARLEPGTRVNVRCLDGVVHIEPAPLPVALRRRGRFLVAVPKPSTPRLTDAAVRETRRRLRRERGTD